jgi:hypothetical protein
VSLATRRGLRSAQRGRRLKPSDTVAVDADSAIVTVADSRNVTAQRIHAAGD